MSDGPEWFAPKRYGYGPGLPISWQGWALTIGFILLVMGLSVALGKHPATLVAAVIPPTLTFIIVSIRTTRGGSRWRWGEDD
jgi:hypothetical protein